LINWQLGITLRNKCNNRPSTALLAFSLAVRVLLSIAVLLVTLMRVGACTAVLFAYKRLALVLSIRVRIAWQPRELRSRRQVHLDLQAPVNQNMLMVRSVIQDSTHQSSKDVPRINILSTFSTCCSYSERDRNCASYV
jgi:hypothetical protein